MEIKFRTKGVVVTSKQKAFIEKKIARLKRYLKDVNPVVVEIRLVDESGPNKGGVDQAVYIDLILPKESIHISEVDDRIMRAFGYSFSVLERRIKRYAGKTVGEKRRKGSKIKKITNLVGSGLDVVSRVIPKRKK